MVYFGIYLIGDWEVFGCLVFTLFIQKCHAHNLIIHIDCHHFYMFFSSSALASTHTCAHAYRLFMAENCLCLRSMWLMLFRVSCLCVMWFWSQFVRATERMFELLCVCVSVCWVFVELHGETRWRWKTRKCNTKRWHQKRFWFGRVQSHTNGHSVPFHSVHSYSDNDVNVYAYLRAGKCSNTQHNRFPPLCSRVLEHQQKQRQQKKISIEFVETDSLPQFRSHYRRHCLASFFLSRICAFFFFLVLEKYFAPAPIRQCHGYKPLTMASVCACMVHAAHIHTLSTRRLRYKFRIGRTWTWITSIRRVFFFAVVRFVTVSSGGDIRVSIHMI